MTERTYLKEHEVDCLKDLRRHALSTAMAALRRRDNAQSALNKGGLNKLEAARTDKSRAKAELSRCRWQQYADALESVLDMPSEQMKFQDLNAEPETNDEAPSAPPSLELADTNALPDDSLPQTDGEELGIGAAD